MRNLRKRAFVYATAATVFAATAAFAHDANEQHDAVHDQLGSTHAQVHDLVNEGLLSPSEHNAIDARLEAQHRNAHAGLAHDDLHDRLDQQHSQVHDLLNEGTISQQEHDRLDARLAAQHRRAHHRTWASRINNNRNGYWDGRSYRVNTNSNYRTTNGYPQ